MSDIGFQGAKFGTKWLICILWAAYHGHINSKKKCKWTWLVALTDVFDFQKEKHQNCIYNLEI